MRVLAAVLLIVTVGSLWLVSAAQAEVVATAFQTINVRSGPGTQFEIVGQLAEGDIVPVNGRESEESRWYRVTLPDGQEGWVSSYTVMLDTPPDDIPVVEPDGEATDTSTVLITTFGRVNVRSGPGINYDVIGQLDVDEEAHALARNNIRNDWLYIEHDLVSGWVAYFTVNVDGDATTLPVRVPDGSGDDLVPPSALIRARFNVRVRQNPTNNSDIVTLVEFDSKVLPVARTENSQWLYITFESSEGWALTELFEITASSLDTLPVFTPRLVATRQPTLTPVPEVTEEAAAG